MAWLGRDFEDHLIPSRPISSHLVPSRPISSFQAPFHGQGCHPLDQVAPNPWSLEHLQEVLLSVLWDLESGITVLGLAENFQAEFHLGSSPPVPVMQSCTGIFMTLGCA